MTPEMANYLEHMRRKALEATCMAEALNAVIDYPDQKHIAVSLIKALTDLGHVLTEGLDKQNLPAAVTPVAALFTDWKEAKIAEEVAFAGSGDDAEGQQEWATRVAIEKRLMEAPATSATDWAMKITAWCNFGESASQTAPENPQLWAEARAFVGA